MRIHEILNVDFQLPSIGDHFDIEPNDDTAVDGQITEVRGGNLVVEVSTAGYQYLESLGCFEGELGEAEYHGHSVQLGKPMQGDVKKFKVYVKDPKTGNVKKVNFGDPNMRIKKSNPARRRSFRARHHCDNPGPRTKARYWSCRKW
jgi:hypothetical protein